MWVVFLYHEDGVKQILWYKRPSLVMAIDKRGQSENGGRLAAIFPIGRCPTVREILMAQGVASVA